MASPLVLSLSTVFALIGIVLVAIAFGTNNWQEYKVDRAKILAAISTNESLRKVNKKDIYFDRVYGLFRQCFPLQLPDDINSYNDPFGQNCVNVRDYRINTDDTKSLDSLSDAERTRMHLMRTCVAFYIIGLIFLFCCLLCGICGCWRRSASLILSTGILLLFATLFLAAAMAVWHVVDYLQREVIDQPGFYKMWDPLLRANTEISYGWSYIIAWIGICCIFIASILMLFAYRAMKEEERDEFEKKRAPYMMSNYYDSKNAMVSPYNYQTYGYAYPGYSYPAYAQQGASAGNGYYGYLTYGR